MKFKALFSLLFLLTCVVNLTAQSSNLDVIYLKDGKRVKGVIQNYVPNKFVDIMVDGQVIQYNAKEVKRIINNKNAVSNNSNRPIGTTNNTKTSDTDISTIGIVGIGSEWKKNSL